MGDWFDRKHKINIYCKNSWHIKIIRQFQNRYQTICVPTPLQSGHDGRSLLQSTHFAYQSLAADINHTDSLTQIIFMPTQPAFDNIQLTCYVCLSLRHLLCSRHVCQWIYAVQYIMTKSLNTGKCMSLWNQQVQGSVIASQYFVQTCVWG
jgi:hypothetical protein